MLLVRPTLLASVFTLGFAALASCGESSAPANRAPSSTSPRGSSAAVEPVARACAPLAWAEDVELRGLSETATERSGVLRTTALGDVAQVADAIGGLFEALARGGTSLRHAREAAHHGPDRVPSFLSSVEHDGLCPVRLTSLRYEHGTRSRVLAAVVMEDRRGAFGAIELELWRHEDETWHVSLGRLARDHHALRDLREATLQLPALAQVTARWSSGAEAWVTRVGAPDASVLCVDAEAAEGRDVRCLAGAPREERPGVGMWEGRVSIDWRPRDCFALPWPSGAPLRVRCNHEEDEGHPTDALTDVTPLAALGVLGEVGIARDGSLVQLSAGRFTELCVLHEGTAACADPIDSREDIELTCASGSSALDASGVGWVAIPCSRTEGPGMEMAAGDRMLAVVHREAHRLALQGVLPVGAWTRERFDHDPLIPRTQWESDDSGSTEFAVDAAGCVTIGAARVTRTTRVNGRVTSTRDGDPSPVAPDVVEGLFPDTVYERLDTAGSWMPEGVHGFRRMDACPVR